MAAKRSKGTARSIVDAIRELLRQPLSDESYEVPTADAVRRSKRVAAKTKKGATKKRAVKKRVTRKAKPAARKKKR